MTYRLLSGLALHLLLVSPITTALVRCRATQLRGEIRRALSQAHAGFQPYFEGGWVDRCPG